MIKPTPRWYSAIIVANINKKDDFGPYIKVSDLLYNKKFEKSNPFSGHMAFLTHFATLAPSHAIYQIVPVYIGVRINHIHL